MPYVSTEPDPSRSLKMVIRTVLGRASLAARDDLRLWHASWIWAGEIGSTLALLAACGALLRDASAC